MNEKTPDDMRFWSVDAVVEYDKFHMNEQLNKIGTNYNFEETSWNPTIVQRFIITVNKIFVSTFPYAGKMSWDMKKIDNKPVLEARISTTDYGVLTVEIPVDKIRSPKCPPNLPEKLIENFIKNFNKKVKKQ